MTDTVPASRQALREALGLSDEILRNIELNEIPLANIALKTSRLARLLNDFTHQKVMEYEVSGYPSTPAGAPPDVYKLAVLAEREFEQQEADSKVTGKFIYRTSIEELERELSSFAGALAAAHDPNVSVSSANPTKWYGTRLAISERNRLHKSAEQAQSRLSSRRSFIYSYVLKRHHELKFSGIAEDIFSRVRERVDSTIGDRVPEAAQKLSAVYENLQSENPEDWSAIRSR